MANGAGAQRGYLARRDLLTGGVTIAGMGGATALYWPESAGAQTSPPATSVYNVKDYGAVGDKTTEDSDAIEDALAAALANGGGVVWFPAGDFIVSKTLRLNGHSPLVLDSPVTVQGAGEASTIWVNNTESAWEGSPRLFLAQGETSGSVSMGASAAAGSGQLSVPNSLASTLEVGAILCIKEDVLDGEKSELHKVLRVVNDTVDLDSPLVNDYTTEATAFKVAPVEGLVLRDLQIRALERSELEKPMYSFRVEWGANIQVNNVRITDGPGGILFVNVVDGHIADCTIDGLPNWIGGETDGYHRAQYGYGVTMQRASANVTISGLVGRGCRHLFTTLGPSGPRNITVVGGVGEGGMPRGGQDGPKAVWDTHAAGTDIAFVGCLAVGVGTEGHPGFQIRSREARIIDCVSRYNASHGVKVHEGASAVIQGGEFSHNVKNGIGGTGRIRVDGADIHHNGKRGVLVTGGPFLHVTNCYIHDNVAEGIRDQADPGDKCEHVVLAGNIVPIGASGNQQTSVSGIGGGDAVIANNVFLGYGSGDDGTWDVQPTVSQNNVTDP